MPPKRKSATSNSAGTPKKQKKQTKTTDAGKKTSPSKVGKATTPTVKDSGAGNAKSKRTAPAGKTKVSAVATSSSSLSSFLSDPEWSNALQEEFEQDYFKALEKQLMSEYQKSTVFPPKEQIFHALNQTPLDKVKVVIIGQDPYHDDGQAMGLAFSVPMGQKVPPSLRNMYKELATDIAGFSDPGHGCLEKWAQEGVLLLNATLTVEAHKPNSHKSIGWQKFTDKVIQVINEKCDKVVFLLWGNFAHNKGRHIDVMKHIIVKGYHPSPLSFEKFKGCKCFSLANKKLKAAGKTPIDWLLK